MAFTFSEEDHLFIHFLVLPYQTACQEQSFQKLRVYLAPSVLDIFDAHCTLNVHIGTGKYLSDGLILASTNPKYDDRLFIELRVQYMKIPSSEHVENMLCT